MIALWGARLLGFMKGLPWWVYAAALVMGAWWIDRGVQYREGRAEGREAVLAELRDAEAKSRKKAATAARKADTKAEKRALAEAEVRAADIAAIEKAEAEEGNAIDAIF